MIRKVFVWSNWLGPLFAFPENWFPLETKIERIFNFSQKQALFLKGFLTQSQQHAKVSLPGRGSSKEPSETFRTIFWPVYWGLNPAIFRSLHAEVLKCQNCIRAPLAETRPFVVQSLEVYNVHQKFRPVMIAYRRSDALNCTSNLLNWLNNRPYSEAITLKRSPNAGLLPFELSRFRRLASLSKRWRYEAFLFSKNLSLTSCLKITKSINRIWVKTHKCASTVMTS